MLALISRIISSGAPRSDVNMLNDKANTAEFKPLLKQGLNAYFTAQKGAVYQCDFQEADLQDEVFGEYNVNNLPLPLSKPFLTDNGVGFAYLPYEISWYANGRISSRGSL